MNSVIIYIDISDHLPVAVHLESRLSKIKGSSTCFFRCYDPKSLENFNIALSNDSRFEVANNLSLTQNDPNNAYTHFSTAYTDLFEKHFPKKLVRKNHKLVPQAEWMTKGLLKSCNKRSFLYKRYRKSGTSPDREKHIKSRNKLKIILKQAKQMYYHSKFNLLSGDLDQT